MELSRAKHRPSRAEVETDMKTVSLFVRCRDAATVTYAQIVLAANGEPDAPANKRNRGDP